MMMRTRKRKVRNYRPIESLKVRSRVACLCRGSATVRWILEKMEEEVNLTLNLEKIDDDGDDEQISQHQSSWWLCLLFWRLMLPLAPLLLLLDFSFDCIGHRRQIQSLT
jgi:hypothetical protein